MKFDYKTISKFNITTMTFGEKQWHCMPITEEKLWDIVKFFRELDNEYVITEDIEELTDIHKDMEDFEFLGTKSVEIIVPLKYK